MTTSADIQSLFPRADRSTIGGIVSMAYRLGTNPLWIALVINFESGFNPAARNPYSDASGLIQFIPSTAARLGTSTAVIRSMSASQQLSLVEAYFRPYVGRLTSLQSVAMAVFYPKFMNVDPSTPFPESVQRVNPGIRIVGDYTNKVLRKTPSAIGLIDRGFEIAIGEVSALPRWLLIAGGISATVIGASIAWRLTHRSEIQ